MGNCPARLGFRERQQMDRPLRGIFLKCCSVTVFIVMASLVKATSGEGMNVPPGEQVFFRSFFALPVILVWLILQGKMPEGLRTVRPMSHFVRGIAGTGAMAMVFTSLALLPLPEATAIGYAMPLIVVVFAAIFLREKVRLFRLSTVGLGLAGVLIILVPQLSGGGGSGQALGALAALAGASLAALAQVFIRRMVHEESTSAIVFWFSMTSTLLSLLTLPFGWVLPGPATFAMLVAIGLLGGLGQILMTSAYRYGEASLIAPFEYTSMLLSLIIGWYFFDEIATPTTLFGAALIIFAGLLIIWRERRLGLERTRQRKAMTPQG